LFKDPLGGQTLLKNYMNSLRSFELARLEYLQNLNDINLTINTELVEKLTNIFTGKLVASIMF